MAKIHSVHVLPSGTELELIELKGKAYLLVADRLVWLNEVHPHFDITTKFLTMTNDAAVCTATVTIFDPDRTNERGESIVIKRAVATKAETKQGHSDFIEKSETGAIGRALAMLGIGTQHVRTDFDEGDRIVDAPVTPAKKADAKPVEVEVKPEPVKVENKPSEPPKSPFRRNRTTSDDII